MSLWSRIERRLGELAGDLLPSEHREQVETARVSLEAGDAEGAEELLADAVAARPDDAGAQSLLGAARLALGRPEDALPCFDAAIAVYDDLPEAHIGRGESCFALGRRTDAVASFRRAVDSAGGDKPILAAAYRGLGLSYLADGDTERAVRELRKAIAEDPDDVAALTGIGEAMLDADPPQPYTARRYLERATARDEAASAAWRALGRAELALGHLDAAAHAFEQLDSDVVATTGLGDVALDRGDLDAARGHYEQALASAPRSGELHARIGDLHRAAGDGAAALASYQRGVQLGAGLDVVRRALDTALAIGDTGEATIDLANRVLADDARDPRALTARGLALAHGGQLDAARATYRAVLDETDDVEAHLALGQLELAAGDGVGAATHAWSALHVEPRNERARRLLADARACEMAGAPTAPDTDEPYQIAVDLQRVTMARADLADMVGDVAQAATDFDQPLLVTVMGEFSSGKSTFINAFVKEDIAPVGITPTTATINVLKFGRERGGRILYRDGRLLSLPWPAFSATLRELTGDDARAVASVEILYPLAELERVNIVDTPGLNSILPEHEAVARDFIARADAIVWLFTAGQAGKQTEREALERIRGEGKRVLGVLNKTDQLSPAEVQQLVDHVSGELGDLVEALVPLSARQALDSQEAGNWPALAAALEQRFFSQARELKRAACSRRLSVLLGRARARVQDRHAAAAGAAASLGSATDALRDERAAFTERLVPDIRRALHERTAELYRTAAREVLALVRPRSLPFGSHRASPPDRDYLLSLLDAGFTEALRPARARVVDALAAAGHRAAAAIARESGVVGADRAVQVERLSREAARLVEAQVFDRADAFVRGYLRGGVVDRFFRQALPKLELTEDAAYHALYRDSPDVDAEVGDPLLASGAAALDALCDRLDHLAGVADAIAYDIDAGVEHALQQLDARRRALD